MFNGERLVEEFIRSGHVPSEIATDHASMENFRKCGNEAMKCIENADCIMKASDFDSYFIAYGVLKTLCNAYIAGADCQDGKSYDEGYKEGNSCGYNEGWRDGHDEGYEEGYSDAKDE